MQYSIPDSFGTLTNCRKIVCTSYLDRYIYICVVRLQSLLYYELLFDEVKLFILMRLIFSHNDFLLKASGTSNDSSNEVYQMIYFHKH